MEEQSLLLKENLLNLRRVLVTNRTKLSKIRYKRSIAEQEKIRFEKIRMREKMLETPRNIDRSLRGGSERSAVKNASKSGLGNALGLLAIYLIATNFDKIKKLVTDFIKGDTFKSIASVFTNIKDFFVNMFKGFTATQELFGEKYQEFIAFKDEKIEDFKKIAEKFEEIGEKFKELQDFAIELKKKFDNILLGTRGNVSIEEEKAGLEKYGFNDEDYNLEMQEDGTYKITPKNDVSNLRLTDFNNLASNSNMKMNFNPNTFDGVDSENSSFDFSQYNADETKKEIVMVEKTNTVIVG
tara:strand:- start:202 stop:1092 length:891 start_codon:yes stop_codon:yes gene_type:complete